VIRVLVVDDEPVAAAAHATYLARLDGFELAGICATAREAHSHILAALGSGTPVDLLLLDISLPDASGLDLARALRAAKMDIDFIAVTAVRNTDTLQAALGVGAVQYLIKPFGFAVFREKLEHYRRYHSRLETAARSATQQDVDELFAARRPAATAQLPKGLSSVTLDAVSAHLRRAEAPASASESAAQLALSRVTARRYLEHLADLGMVTRTQRYGAPGRPEVEYSWCG
jgi:response regulator of citrate/malate metabolism